MRRRILATIVAVTTFAVAAFFIPAALAIRSRIQRGDLLELQREASIVASRIPPTGLIVVDEVREAIGPGHLLAFYDSTGQLITGDGPATADALVRIALDGTFAEGYENGELVAAVPVRPGPYGPELVVRISEPRGESAARVATAIRLLALAAAGVVAASAVVGVLLARRLSRPVEDLQTWAGHLGRDDASQAPPPTGIAELDELGASLATADERVRELLQRERSFSSHASHQLRTPVAAMRVAIEAELASPRDDHTEVLTEALGALDRLESTITSLLALARHDGHERVDCDLTEVVADQARHWEATYAGSGRSIHTAGPVLPAHLEPSAVRHILDVLLDNALRHGSGTVTVATRRAGHLLHIDVGDEGAPPSERDPFSERRSDAGHGIGLRLARTLAESEGGQLQLVPAATTVFRLSLPDRRSPDVHSSITPA